MTPAEQSKVRAAALARQMTHTQSSGMPLPGIDRYFEGRETPTRGVPLESPMLSPDDLLGAGMLKKAGLVAAALGGTIKSIGKPVSAAAAKRLPLNIGPQAEAMRLAQQRAALPPEKNGLGLPPDNTPEQRAAAMGFSDDRYHGSLYDIEKPNLNKASTESHAGQGFYSTDSPRDASQNYASIYGPDVRNKIERQLENIGDDKNIGRIHRRFIEAPQSPMKPSQEVAVANTVGADNLGVVYPLKVRADNPLHLDSPDPRTKDLGPFQKYDAEYDEYADVPEARKLERAFRNHQERGGDTEGIQDVLSDYYGEAVPPSRLYHAAHKSAGNGYMHDEDGNVISQGVAAADFVKELGVDQIAHRPQFRSPQLNIGGEHTISLNPDNVRSRFAAFDPWRLNATVAALMGVASPNLLAAEQPRNKP